VLFSRAKFGNIWQIVTKRETGLFWRDSFTQRFSRIGEIWRSLHPPPPICSTTRCSVNGRVRCTRFNGSSKKELLMSVSSWIKGKQIKTRCEGQVFCEIFYTIQRSVIRSSATVPLPCQRFRFFSRIWLFVFTGSTACQHKNVSWPCSDKISTCQATKRHFQSSKI
jgi:hypothetical protein